MKRDKHASRRACSDSVCRGRSHVCFPLCPSTNGPHSSGGGAAILITAGTAAAATADCSVQSLQALKVPRVTVTAAKRCPQPAEAGVLRCAGLGCHRRRRRRTGIRRFWTHAAGQLERQVHVRRRTWHGRQPGSSANKPDIDIALARGYASATTDSGHSNREESWYYVGKPGVPNVPKLTDYYYRATHQVTLATKEFVKSYYGAPAHHACVLQWLLEWRTTGDHGGGSLSRRLRRHHRRLPVAGSGRQRTAQCAAHQVLSRSGELHPAGQVHRDRHRGARQVRHARWRQGRTDPESVASAISIHIRIVPRCADQGAGRRAGPLPGCGSRREGQSRSSRFIGGQIAGAVQRRAQQRRRNAVARHAVRNAGAVSECSRALG